MFSRLAALMASAFCVWPRYLSGSWTRNALSNPLIASIRLISGSPMVKLNSCSASSRSSCSVSGCIEPAWISTLKRTRSRLASTASKTGSASFWATLIKKLSGV